MTITNNVNITLSVKLLLNTTYSTNSPNFKFLYVIVLLWSDLKNYKSHGRRCANTGDSRCQSRTTQGVISLASHDIKLITTAAYTEINLLIIKKNNIAFRLNCYQIQVAPLESQRIQYRSIYCKILCRGWFILHINIYA